MQRRRPPEEPIGQSPTHEGAYHRPDDEEREHQLGGQLTGVEMALDEQERERLQPGEIEVAER